MKTIFEHVSDKKASLSKQAAERLEKWTRMLSEACGYDCSGLFISVEEENGKLVKYIATRGVTLAPTSSCANIDEIKATKKWRLYCIHAHYQTDDKSNCVYCNEISLQEALVSLVEKEAFSEWLNSKGYRTEKEIPDSIFEKLARER